MKLSVQIMLTAVFAFGVGLTSLTPSIAQGSESVVLELNKLEPADKDCLLTFVVSSKSSKNLDKLAYEFVVFDDQLRVQRMTVFDFRELEAGKLRVRQFQLPQTQCSGLGRLLINDVSACDGNEVDASLCSSGLQISNKTNIEFLN
ncbi:MAG: hypothetical protein AAGA76_05090 [Pseudomonadota bacterium]